MSSSSSDALLDLKPCLKNVANDEVLKQELLSAQVPQIMDAPKKGTKLYIVSQIEHLCNTAGMVIEESNRDLMRQNKAELKATLARYMERASERRMRAVANVGTRPVQDAADEGIRVGEESNASDNRRANIFILRMLHDTVLGGLEKVYESYGSHYTGYTIEGLCKTLQDEPHTSRVDEILVQIAEEQPELLDMFESSYAKLALCWLMAAVTVARRKAANSNKDGHRNGHVPPIVGHGPADLGRRPDPADGGKRVQFADSGPTKGREELPDRPAAESTGDSGAGGSGDPGVRGERPVQRTDEEVLRPEVRVQGMAVRIV